MEKKLLIILLALISAITCALGFTACDNTDNDNSGTVSTPPTAGLKYSQYNCTSSACKGIGTATKTEIVIAGEYSNLPVEYICDSAFKDCTFITTISIPDSVYVIENSAFFGCSSLKSINFAGTVDRWNKIRKSADWDESTGDYVIHCTDGNIEKS